MCQKRTEMALQSRFISKMSNYISGRLKRRHAQFMDFFAPQLAKHPIYYPRNNTQPARERRSSSRLDPHNHTQPGHGSQCTPPTVEQSRVTPSHARAMIAL